MKGYKNLTLAVYDRIKYMMVNYDIIPGQRLTFVDLAKQLGVSRTPVNNALSILAKEGYLDFVPNQGYRVHKLTQEEAQSLYEIREILETGTIEKALARITEKKFQVMEKRKQDYEAAISDRVHRKLFLLDTEFHAGLIEMVGNKFLTERYREICLKIVLRFRTEDLRMERINDIITEHTHLLEAIKTRQAEDVKRLIQNHNKNAQENLFAVIFRNESSVDNMRIQLPSLS